jgi:6-phosphogluconate dehydrogenase
LLLEKFYCNFKVIMTSSLSEIGLVGLAVMGQNLALNIADHGYQISVYNRTAAKTELFIAKNPNTPAAIIPSFDLKAFVNSIRRPRKIILLVQAGQPTTAVIQELIPFLEKGDIVIDAGNAHWVDTINREALLKAQGMHFIGSGISGGEEGARFGPSLMAGGAIEAWKELEPIWKAVAAKVDTQTGKPLAGAQPGRPIQGGESCAAHVGTGGAGHYVKMVHNGIEYADMQLICEAYDLMQHILKLSAADMSTVFTKWNQGVLESYLIEITAEVLKQKDPVTGKPFVDIVQDQAGQKGTGKWTSTSALEMEVPTPTIVEAVLARYMSGIKPERLAASQILKGPNTARAAHDNVDELLQAIQDALYCSKICSYAQGFQLMSEAQRVYGWKLNFGQIAQIWRGGCIIRARFLQKITEAYNQNPELPNLLLDPYFAEAIANRQAAWRKVVSLGVIEGIPLPCFTSALAYFDSYRQARLPHNLLQGLRDYFGAHLYERVDAPKGKFFHLEWSASDRQQTEIS